MSPQYGQLRPPSSQDRLAGLGHPSKFQWLSCLGFVTAATSLSGSQPNFARCLAVSWAGRLYIGYIFGGCCPVAVASSKFCALLYWQRYCTALEQWNEPNFAALSTRRHLYLAGQPSRWALAHILVYMQYVFEVIVPIFMCYNLYCIHLVGDLVLHL